MVVVASAAHLARSLYLVAQVRETALPVVVALTMGDVAARRGIRVDADALAAPIGCPVVALDPRRRSGVDGAGRGRGHRARRGGPVRAPAGPRAVRPAGDAADELAAADERFALDRHGRHGIREHARR